MTLIFFLFLLVPFSLDSGDYTWNDQGERIFYFIGDQYVEQNCKPDEQGCHHKHYSELRGVFHVIYVPDNPFTYTHAGCNIWTHEIIHAYGYNEGMIRDFFDCRGSQFDRLPIRP